MNKKLLFAVLLMLVAVAIVCHAQGEQPPDINDLRAPGKRSFKVEFSISNWKKMKIGNPNKKIDKVMTVDSSFFSTIKARKTLCNRFGLKRKVLNLLSSTGKR